MAKIRITICDLDGILLNSFTAREDGIDVNILANKASDILDAALETDLNSDIADYLSEGLNP